MLIGAGYGVEKKRNKAQGANFVPGNDYIAEADLRKIKDQRRQRRGLRGFHAKFWTRGGVATDGRC